MTCFAFLLFVAFRALLHFLSLPLVRPPPGKSRVRTIRSNCQAPQKQMVDKSTQNPTPKEPRRHDSKTQNSRSIEPHPPCRPMCEKAWALGAADVARFESGAAGAKPIFLVKLPCKIKRYGGSKALQTMAIAGAELALYLVSTGGPVCVQIRCTCPGLSTLLKARAIHFASHFSRSSRCTSVCPLARKMAEARPQTYYSFVEECVTSLPHFEVSGMQWGLLRGVKTPLFFSVPTSSWEHTWGRRP